MGLLAVLLVCLYPAFATASSADGPYYNCSKVVATSELTLAEACQKTIWCIYASDSGQCVYDFCLRAASTEAPCPPSVTSPGGLNQLCSYHYMTDKHDCNNGSEIKADQYCRASAASYVKASLGGQTCFYSDLKSIGVDPENPGPRGSCSDKVCDWVNKSGFGNICDFGGSEDCSDYNEAQLDSLCGCLGVTNCDLHPHCINSSNACIADPCFKMIPPATVPKQCTSASGAESSTCKGRIEQYYNTVKGELDTRIVCTNQTKTKPNECFYAVKSTTTKSDKYPQYSECDVTNVDESICTSAKAYNEDVDPPSPDTATGACQLVPIATGYFTQTQYCTDGDRTVPSPDMAVEVRIPFLLAFLVLAIFALV